MYRGCKGVGELDFEPDGDDRGIQAGVGCLMVKAQGICVMAEREGYDGEPEVEGDEENGFLGPGHLELPDEVDR